jgi:hypothetical protein
MTSNVLLVCGYAAVLIAVGYGFDAMARRVAVKAQRWRTGSFRYHEDHDAWTCAQDQWLWPKSYDPEQRIVRYRGKPSVCNACPVKSTCTGSHHGREVTREIDPWPHSEAGRFHRGIACCIASLAVLLPLAMLVSGPSLEDVALLVCTAVVATALWVPLARHLWKTPSGFPEHIAQKSLYEEAPADRFTTVWGSFEPADSAKAKEPS